MGQELSQIRIDLLAWAGLHRGKAIREEAMPRFHEIIDVLTGIEDHAMPLQLIVGILDGLCTAIDPIVPFIDWSGVDVGQCRYCRVAGEMHYCSETTYKHLPACVEVLRAQLRQALPPTKEVAHG